jgi:hypothetical protein
MFHNTNPTQKYVVAIDDVVILIDDKKDAHALYNSIASIDESPFGAMRLMAPGQIDKNIYGEIATESILAGVKVVNPDYITKHTARINARYIGRKDTLATSTAKERLSYAKGLDFSSLFGVDANYDWRANRMPVA